MRSQDIYEIQRNHAYLSGQMDNLLTFMQREVGQSCRDESAVDTAIHVMRELLKNVHGDDKPCANRNPHMPHYRPDRSDKPVSKYLLFRCPGVR